VNISCTSSYYQRGLLYAICMILVYPVGIPLLYYAMLRANKFELANRDDETLYPNPSTYTPIPDTPDTPDTDPHPSTPLAISDDDLKGNMGPEPPIPTAPTAPTAPTRTPYQSMVSERSLPLRTLPIPVESQEPLERPPRPPAFQLRRSVSHIDRMEVIEKEHLSNAVRRISFLWEPYEPRFWYWEVRGIYLSMDLSVYLFAHLSLSLFSPLYFLLPLTLSLSRGSGGRNNPKTDAHGHTERDGFGHHSSSWVRARLFAGHAVHQTVWVLRAVRGKETYI
jgi:hypothetical protein